MKNNFELEKASFFSGIEKEEVCGMLKCLDSKHKKFKKGEYIIRLGETVDNIGMLLSGEAFIIQEDFWGNRNLIKKIMPLQIFAEAFACATETLSSISVTAHKDCEVLFMSVKKILSPCQKSCAWHSRLLSNLLSEISYKNLYLNDKLTHISQRSTKEKLMSYLSAESQKTGSESFDIPFNRQQLADYLCVERSAMSAELSKLKNEGVIDYSKNHFVLL